MNAAICAAIRERRRLVFTYDGLERTVEPHVHGVARDGTELLRGYQVEGESRSGNEPPWRLFDVAKMADLRDGKDCFRDARPLYNRDDPAMAVVYCRL